ncbi:MAG: hypothetical protein IPM82_22065 [Saprospiraceae bacterium]|nr:hypothetical protein [Saprospiraceae bacterium]
MGRARALAALDRWELSEEEWPSRKRCAYETCAGTLAMIRKHDRYEPYFEFEADDEEGLGDELGKQTALMIGWKGLFGKTNKAKRQVTALKTIAQRTMILKNRRAVFGMKTV